MDERKRGESNQMRSLPLLFLSLAFPLSSPGWKKKERMKKDEKKKQVHDRYINLIFAIQDEKKLSSPTFSAIHLRSIIYSLSSSYVFILRLENSDQRRKTALVCFFKNFSVFLVVRTEKPDVKRGDP